MRFYLKGSILRRGPGEPWVPQKIDPFLFSLLLKTKYNKTLTNAKN